MENVIKIWLPISAIIISVASLFLSLANMKFARRFEAAKKRTELLSIVLEDLSILQTKREQLSLVKGLCSGCPKSRAEELCSRYNEWIQMTETLYKAIESITNVGDPIRVEHLIAHQQKTHKMVTDFVSRIDDLLQKCRDCKERPEIISKLDKSN